jgi:uncharacterized protein
MKLKWSLVELYKSQGRFITIEGKADLTNSLKNRKSELIDASLVDVQGTISIEGMTRYYVDLTLSTTLTLPSSRSLEPVELALVVPFNEVYLAPDATETDAEELEEDDTVFSLEKDILDLQKPIEDTILASIPMKVLSEEEQASETLPNGHDWELRLEDEMETSVSKEESTGSETSPFDVLKDMDLFNEEDEE